MKNKDKITKNLTKEKYFYDEDKDKEIVDFVNRDFENRREERRPYELSWELNMNFMIGNQYSYISPKGDIEDVNKNYYWESREVYNHIAPIVETRLAKLAKVRPTASVRPSSSEKKDVYCSKLSKAIISNTASRLALSDIIGKATTWSEITGTAFYKVVWDKSLGEIIGKNDDSDIKTGDVSISVCSPFEIFPDSSGSVDIEDCDSIIHARAYPSSFIQSEYGIDVEGKDIDTFSFDNFPLNNSVTGSSNIQKVIHATKHDHVLLIERYEKPNSKNKNGKLTIVCANHLLYDGDLPYMLGDKNARAYPFVKQVSSEVVGLFWGTSVVERCIPLQRAYNSIKNRKHEFMTRLAVGVLAVEDGSVDVDNIEEDGLAPGKILVYRNGSTPPTFMDAGHIPSDFSVEEAKLLNEFITLSGVSELMRDGSAPSNVSSGTALNLLIEQDDTRLSVTAEFIRSSVRQISQMILRLYKQFATAKRIAEITDEDGAVELYYWNNADISSDDVVLDTTNELAETPAQRKNNVLELYRNGLLFDSGDGKMSNRMRLKILDALGFGMFELSQDMSALHIKRAQKENLELTKPIVPLEIDDHELHIEEHTKFLLSSESDDFSAEHKEKIEKHIRAHKQLMKFMREEQV